MVVLIAHVAVKPDRIADFQKLADGMLAPSRAEEACISYDYFVKPEDQTQLVFVEEWTTRQGLENHFNLPHFIQFKEQNAKMVNDVKIRIYATSGHEDL